MDKVSIEFNKDELELLKELFYKSTDTYTDSDNQLMLHTNTFNKVCGGLLILKKNQ